MLIKNANFGLNTMLIIAFISNNGVWKLAYTYYARPEKIKSFNNFQSFRALFGLIFESNYGL